MNSSLRFSLIFGAVFILVFSVLLLIGPKITNTSADKPAPDFTVKTFDNKTITLSKLSKSKVIVVNFWASWCGPCREEAAALEEVWRKYKTKILFIGLNYQDKEKDALAFMKEFKVSYPNGPVDNDKAKEYGLTGVPETFIIKDMQIKEHLIGPTTTQDLSLIIEKFL